MPEQVRLLMTQRSANILISFIEWRVATSRSASFGLCFLLRDELLLHLLGDGVGVHSLALNAICARLADVG